MVLSNTTLSFLLLLNLFLSIFSFFNGTIPVLFIHIVSSPTKRLALVLTGSFNPVTIAHLRMLELARDYYHLQSIQVVEGIISPVSDSYGKPGLAKVNHRIEMLQAAISNDPWLRIDTWEAEQTSWTRTKIVLDHHYEVIKKRYGENTELRLLSGADVARSMLDPKIWIPKDIDDIMTKYGLACITRLSAPEPGQGGATVPDVKEGMPDLWKQHIDIIQDWVVNDISATNIRKRLEKGLSVKYIVPDATIKVIRNYGLYNSDKCICLADWPAHEQKQT
ncbi:unnamed protein product [Rotaria sp. Silwood2]|nr:unnamed protein product [Rotaria sp. Silwood2]CAF2624971.1 unnamed protein product [Rotaria sp. Silwood2]CAF2844768.1 unnamed protein product [Rotaria sp. Silwood2]CAF3049285.1 unnamed protein product [Rotaria sp. Silwood2]CAF4190588.1 unnamed protein product [Rotaria sp. Silwood2]